MTIQIIPTSTEPFWSQRTELDGTDYILTFRYNQREGTYYLSLATPAGTSILEGIKLVPDFPLLVDYNVPGQPPGQLWALASSGDASPGLGELGPDGRVSLVYDSVAP